MRAPTPSMCCLRRGGPETGPLNSVSMFRQAGRADYTNRKDAIPNVDQRNRHASMRITYELLIVTALASSNSASNHAIGMRPCDVRYPARASVAQVGLAPRRSVNRAPYR